MKTKKEADSPAPADTREIPPPPGGGSWTFDHEKFEWVSNEPEVQPAVAAQE